MSTETWLDMGVSIMRAAVYSITYGLPTPHHQGAYRVCIVHNFNQIAFDTVFFFLTNSLTCVVLNHYCAAYIQYHVKLDCAMLGLDSINSWAMRDVDVTLQVYLSNSFFESISWSPVKLVLGECHRTPICDQQKSIWSHCWAKKIENNLTKIVISTEAADGLAPLGARPSAASVMSDDQVYDLFTGLARGQLTCILFFRIFFCKF